MMSVSSLPGATTVSPPKLTLTLVVPCEHVALCGHPVLRKVLRAVLFQRTFVGSEALDLEEEAVLLDECWFVGLVGIGFGCGSELPMCVESEQCRVRHWMCKYKTSSLESGRAAVADTFQIAEWIVIFIGDASTDFFVVCFAVIEIWPLQMKARMRVRAISTCAVRLW